MLTTIVQKAAACNAPPADIIGRWANAAYAAAAGRRPRQLTVRIVDEHEGRALNSQYRNVDRATNVLSFEFDAAVGPAQDLLGDVVICAPVVEREAAQQDKSLQAHWAHMVVHGVLHLCGYDHQRDAQAVDMESVEALVMHEFGFADPYRSARGYG